jgi:hypothetical protein
MGGVGVALWLAHFYWRFHLPTAPVARALLQEPQRIARVFPVLLAHCTGASQPEVSVAGDDNPCADGAGQKA